MDADHVVVGDRVFRVPAVVGVARADEVSFAAGVVEDDVEVHPDGGAVGGGGDAEGGPGEEELGGPSDVEVVVVVDGAVSDGGVGGAGGEVVVFRVVAPFEDGAPVVAEPAGIGGSTLAVAGDELVASDGGGGGVLRGGEVGDVVADGEVVGLEVLVAGVVDVEVEGDGVVGFEFPAVAGAEAVAVGPEVLVFDVGAEVDALAVVHGEDRGDDLGPIGERAGGAEGVGPVGLVEHAVDDGGSLGYGPEGVIGGYGVGREEDAALQLLATGALVRQVPPPSGEPRAPGGRHRLRIVGAAGEDAQKRPS
ncbi:MAG: hypothetical protein IPJ41_12040 [Phycisphaerales bacterium]|nr:hypothetical protein [Phycisphaerales bacterium]